MDNLVKPLAGDDSYVKDIEEAILNLEVMPSINLEVMPSMRALMTAGPAFNRDNTAGYNCSYMPVDDRCQRFLIRSLRVTRRSLLRIARRVGLRHYDRSLHCFIVAKYQSGMYLRFALLVPS
jgi:hypothetical protein